MFLRKKKISLLSQEVKNKARDGRAESKSHDNHVEMETVFDAHEGLSPCFLLVTVLVIPYMGH